MPHETWHPHVCMFNASSNKCIRCGKPYYTCDVTPNPAGLTPIIATADGYAANPAGISLTTANKPSIVSNEPDPWEAIRPEIEIMIKYVKHSTRKANRPCAKCGTTDMYWAHEILEDLIVTGDEDDFCPKCETTGALMLVDAKQTPTGKWKLHECASSEQSSAGGDGGDPDESQAEGTPDEIGAGTTSASDPWDGSQDGYQPEPADDDDGNDDGNDEQESQSQSQQEDDPDDPFVKQSEMEAAFVPRDLIVDHLSNTLKELKDNVASGIAIDHVVTKEMLESAIAGVEAGVRPVEVSIKLPDKPAKPLPGLHHKDLATVIQFAAARLHVLMVGGAGVGKGKMVRQAADALGLRFLALPGSLSPQTPVSAITGYMNSTGSYVKTMFREAFENGGLIFLDELDNAHPACMAAANDALAVQPGETIAFPDGMVKRHADFVCMAAANTFGRGADQNYAARQRGDAATWDRFSILKIEIDEPLEMTLCARTGASTQIVSEVLRFVRTLRRESQAKNLPIVLGPRASVDMCKMLAAGIDVETAVFSRCRRGLSDQDWYSLTMDVRDIDIVNAPIKGDFQDRVCMASIKVK